MSFRLETARRVLFSLSPLRARGQVEPFESDGDADILKELLFF